MSQRGRSVGAPAADEPMDIDAGARGLEQSRHHPNHGVSATNQRATGEQEPEGGSRPTEETRFKQLIGMINSGKEGDAEQLFRRYQEEAIEEGRRRERAERDKRVPIVIT